MGRQALRHRAARFARALAGLVALLAIPCAAPALRAGAANAVAAAVRPNVVVITTDDQTVESMRVMSNVNRLLVANGATFDNSFASFALRPSRATFHRPVQPRPRRRREQPREQARAARQSNTLPVWLRHAGYSTILVGKCLNEYGQLQGKVIPPGWTDGTARPLATTTTRSTRAGS
jgi:hypothetical protein